MRTFGIATLILALMTPVSSAQAQARPYVGFAYPAGGQQGTTFRVKLGGQGVEDPSEIRVSGTGVSGKIIEYHRVLGAQETTLLNEQLRDLKRGEKDPGTVLMAGGTPMMGSDQMMASGSGDGGEPGPTDLTTKIERRIAGTVNRPASASLASIVYVEITIDKDAQPGARELRLVTLRGISNPMVFEVGSLPEISRKPMGTSPLQVLGKEESALRKRPPAEMENRVILPCTLNGQIASGERNTYRFNASKGQKLVFNAHARQLIPFIADAVPGWFQPVIALYDGIGKEVAYSDDYQFRPDPTIYYEVPEDGDYVLAVFDALYRGREDFVYRIAAGEIPLVTNFFPLGGSVGALTEVTVEGANLKSPVLRPPAKTDPGVWTFTAECAGFGIQRPFALDTLPETVDKGWNNHPSRPQNVTLPVIINGKIERAGDWDVFRFTGKSNEVLVVEVSARRLESPLDSIIKLTDASGKLIAANDDCEDVTAGVNTHPADSYLTTTLPADGAYFLHLGDTSRKGGEDYGYRLRLSSPQPDFALRLTPSSAALRSKGYGSVNVHVMRKDGFSGPIKVTFKDPPAAFSATPVSLTGTQTVAKLNFKTTLAATEDPVSLVVVGTAIIDGKEVAREAVPAEDRMQAFFWRHLVPANEFAVVVYDPAIQAKPRRVPPQFKPGQNVVKVAAVSNEANKPKFTKQQVTGRLRQLRLLYEEGLLTDRFYLEKVAECEAVRQE